MAFEKQNYKKRGCYSFCLPVITQTEIRNNLSILLSYLKEPHVTSLAEFHPYLNSLSVRCWLQNLAAVPREALAVSLANSTAVVP